MILPRKTNFFRGALGLFNYLGLVIGIDLKFYKSVAKGMKIKSQKFGS